MRLYNWEPPVQAFIQRISSPFVNVLRSLNILLGGEECMTLAVPWLVGLAFLTQEPWVAFLLGVGLLSSRHVEAWAKPWLGGPPRGRPRDPAEDGMPSGDCAVVTIWASVLLGWWAVLPVAVVMWARVALRAHWPLDTVAGVVQGVVLAGPALLMKGVWL